MPAIAEESVVRPVGEHCSRPLLCNGEEPHGAKRQDENRKREDAMRDDLVDLVRHGRLVFALFVQRERLVHEALDEVVALARDDGLSVVANLLLAVADMLLNVLHLSDADIKLADDLAVALEDLDRIPANRAKRHLALN